MCSSSLSWPSGETDWRSRRISRPPSAAGCVERQARVDPAVDARERREAAAPRRPARRAAVARRSPPRRGRRARGGPRRAAAAAAPLGLAAEHLDELHRGDDQLELRARASRRGRRRRRHGSRGRSRDRAARRAPSSRDGSSVNRPDLGAARARWRATRPVPQPSSSTGAVGLGAPARSQSGQVGRIAAALDVVPDRAVRGSLPSNSLPGRAWRAACEARAGPCRWEGRRAGPSASATARSSERSIASSTSIASGGDARVLEPHRHLGGPRAGADDAADAAGEQLEVGVPDPGDVAAVGDPVVERDPEVKAGAAVAPADPAAGCAGPRWRRPGS